MRIAILYDISLNHEKMGSVYQYIVLRSLSKVIAMNIAPSILEISLSVSAYPSIPPGV